MAKSIDDETYGNARKHDADEVKNGNPGRPQSDYETPDPVVQDDPSEFADGSGDVVAGSTHEQD
jgi:hypothetical protein